MSLTYKSTGIKMLKFSHNLKTRNGISIIEVLTSMAVATIGVFGVMVMIPFAVKQSQTGLDNDAASALGRNAIEQLRTEGYLTVREEPFPPPTPPAVGITNEILPIVFDAFPGTQLNYNLDRIGQTINVGGGITFDFPGFIHFDPIGYSSGLTNTPIGSIDIPSVNATRRASVGDIDGSGSIDAAELAGAPISVREAGRLCRSRDEMFYEAELEGVEETAPPQPLFDIDGGNPSKRQFSGRISWSAFLTPEKDPSLTSSPVSRFRSNVLVYRDRFISPGTAGTPPRVSNRDVSPNPASCFDFYQVAQINGQFAGNPIDSVNQITLNGTVDTEELVRGDWIMLVNRIPEATPSFPIRNGSFVAEEGYRIQTMFAEVTRVSDNGVAITVDGGPFDFVVNGNVLPGSVNPPSSLTYMVHLKNVVNVYERSVAVER